MNRRICGATIAMCLLAASVSAQQYYLYTPKATSAEEAARTTDGVLVRDVPVSKGDTLSGISRKFSGHSTYYPQILLFNQIKDPNRIIAGDTIKVPVTKTEQSPQEIKKAAPHVKAEKHPATPAPQPKKTTAPAPVKPQAKAPEKHPITELSLSDLKQTEAATRKKQQQKPKQQQARTEKATQPKKRPIAEAPKSAPTEERRQQPVKSAQSDEAPSGQKLFERAVKAYRRDDCQTALELFDRFLADNASSPLAADASLYKAECYLKQSK